MTFFAADFAVAFGLAAGFPTAGFSGVGAVFTRFVGRGCFSGIPSHTGGCPSVYATGCCAACGCSGPATTCSFLIMERPRLFFGSMPRTAFSITHSGLLARSVSYRVPLMPPGYPEWRYEIFLASLPPVISICDALMTMTLSPTSMCGAKIGLCLPRRMAATSEARRPRTWPLASITYQRRTMCSGFGE